MHLVSFNCPVCGDYKDARLFANTIGNLEGVPDLECGNCKSVFSLLAKKIDIRAAETVFPGYIKAHDTVESEDQLRRVS